MLDRTLALTVEVAGSAGVRVERDGAFGEMAGENATPLALVFTELVTNAVEHGLKGGGGTVVVRAVRDGRHLEATVSDDGVGLPPDFVPGPGGPRHPDRAGTRGGRAAGAHLVGRRAPAAAPGHRRGDPPA